LQDLVIVTLVTCPWPGIDTPGRLTTQLNSNSMELEKKRALHALFRLSIASFCEQSYPDLYKNSTLEDDYFYILELILNNNNNNKV